MDACPTHLAGHRVIATELVIGGHDPLEPVAGDWWSLVPLARGGSLATVLAEDTITAYRLLDTATAARPGLPARDRDPITDPGHVDREPAYATSLG